MPHTSHRKKTQRAKRTEITDEDGWTRVATTNSSQRKPRPLPVQKALEERYENTVWTYPKVMVPDGKTVEQLEEQYRKIEKRWLESDSYKALDTLLKNDLDQDTIKDIDKCFIFGSDTLSGMRHGWIDRSHVAMFQVAAFVSVVNIIESISGKRPLAYAQEPVYTSLDIDFLSRLKLVVLDTPAGFKKITTQSFTVALGAELSVSLRVMACNPAMSMKTGKLDMFWRNERGEACTNTMEFNVRQFEPADVRGGDLGEEHDDKSDDFNVEDYKPYHELTAEQREHIDSFAKDRIEQGLEICEGFLKDKEFRRLPGLDAKDEPFHDVHIYYRRAQEVEAGGVGNEEPTQQS